MWKFIKVTDSYNKFYFKFYLFFSNKLHDNKNKLDKAIKLSIQNGKRIMKFDEKKKIKIKHNCTAKEKGKIKIKTF